MGEEGSDEDVAWVGDWAKLSKKMLLRLTREGSIPGTKVGRAWRFRRSQLLDLLNARSAE